MIEILLIFLLPLLLFLPIIPKIVKRYMSRTQVPEEDQRVETINDLKNYEPRPKAVIRTEGKEASNDKLENFYWWDPSGEASNADGSAIIESNVSGYGNGEIDEGVWRRFVSPMSEARNQIDIKDNSSVTRDAGYSLLNARYTGKSAFWYKDVSDLSLLRDLMFNDDGSKIYLVGSTSNIIEQYSLSDPYNISTGSFETRINTKSDFDWSPYVGDGEDPIASDFVNGGSNLFFISANSSLSGGGSLHKIELGTPYDLSSASTAKASAEFSNRPSSIEFHPNDGQKFFSGDGNGEIEEYTLDGGSFDLSNGISVTNRADISSNVSDPRSCTFNDDGRAFFTTGFSSDKVYKFELPAAYDIAGSAKLTETFDVTETMESPEFITFNGDGSNFFLGYTSSGKYYEFESTVSRIDVRNTLSGGDGINFDSETGKISNKFADGNGNVQVSKNKWIGNSLYESYLPEADNLGVGGTNHGVLRAQNNLYLTANSNGNEDSFNIIFGGNSAVPGDGGFKEQMRIINRDGSNEAINVNGGILLESNNAPSLKISDEDSDTYAEIASIFQGTLTLSADPLDNRSDGGVVFKTNGTEKARVDENGNLGVGVKSPNRSLHVNSDSGDVAARIESSNDPYTWLSFVGPGSTSDTHTLIGNEGDDLLFRSGDAEQMRIDDAGNVGIGTDSPSEKLDLGSGKVLAQKFVHRGAPGEIPLAYRESRSLAPTVDDYVEIGDFYVNTNYSSIKLTISESSAASSKQYLLPVANGETNGNWREALPIAGANRNSSDDFSLQVNAGSYYTKLRIRRSSVSASSGSTMNLNITIRELGSKGDNFTPKNGTGSTSKKPFFGGTVISQKDGKVGIGTGDPNKKLDVNGTLNVRETELITQDSNPVFTVEDDQSLTVGTVGDPDIDDGGGNFTGGSTFIGVYAGIGSTTTGARNTCVGRYSGYNVQDGEGNSCLGASSGAYLTSGTFNTMIGDSAGYSTSTGSGNVFVGSETGNQNDTGEKNTFVGRRAGRNATSVSRSVAIGHKTMEDNTGQDAVAIGYKAGQSNSQDNQFILENKSVTATPLIQGDFSTQKVGIGKSSPSKELDVAGQLTLDDSYIRNLSNVSSSSSTSGDDFYSVNSSGGSVTLTLSSSDAEDGRVVHVKRNGSNVVTIDTEGSKTIDESSSVDIDSDKNAVKLVYNSSNSNWEIY